MADKALIERLKAQVEAVESGAVSPVVGKPAHPDGSRTRAPIRRAAGDGKAQLACADDALSKIVALVNVSDRSERAIRERLDRCGFAPSAVDEAVERARAYGFVDDGRFAAALIRSRLSQGKGIPGIERELRTHGIEIDAVPGWPEEFDANEDSEIDRALALLAKRPPRSKNLRDGAYRKLVGKGFSSSVASSAARIWSER